LSLKQQTKKQHKNIKKILLKQFKDWKERKTQESTIIAYTYINTLLFFFIIFIVELKMRRKKDKEVEVIFVII
jgi:hypothetical protein